MGFADSPATRDALTDYGVRVSGYVWRWAPGLKGGTFPPHLDVNGEHAPTADSFNAYPGEDVNGDSCMCNLAPVYRNSDGTFARPDNLVPIFQPPTTASLELYRPDFGPLIQAYERAGELVDKQITAFSNPQPVNVTVQIPDSAIVVNLPPFDFRLPNQPAPVVNVDARPQTIPAPIVNVSSPDVTVNVPKQAAPTVNVDVKPTPVKVIREKMLGKSVRFFRSGDGKIESAEVTE